MCQNASSRDCKPLNCWTNGKIGTLDIRAKDRQQGEKVTRCEEHFEKEKEKEREKIPFRSNVCNRVAVMHHAQGKMGAS